MRLNLYWRGIDLVDVEFHAGGRGLYLDLNVFRPRSESGGDGSDGEMGDGERAVGEVLEGKADLSGTAALIAERAEGPVWEEDQPAVVRFWNDAGSGSGSRIGFSGGRWEER